MATLALGINAYKRHSGREPEIKLVNRYVEESPPNLAERVTLLSRPGNHLLGYFPAEDGKVRGLYSREGLFDSDLFVVAGPNLWRYDGTNREQVSGIVMGSGAPRVAWAKGIGYERLFIADGQQLLYYGGRRHATATLTDDEGGAYTSDIVVIGGVYYGWGAGVTDPDADGTLAHPFIAVPGADPLAAMADMLNYDGVPGVDFSSTLGGPNLSVYADVDDLEMTVTARVEGSAGNAVTVAVTGSPPSGFISWGAGVTTLSGGGTGALIQVAVPDGQPITAVTSLNGYVLASVGNSQRFYFLRPGEVVIDPLDFFTKESQPDPIIDMATVGDVAVIAGAGSTEYWAVTGDASVPLEPVQGRTTGRGIISGTMVVMDESSYMAVGNDGRVYTFSPSPQVVSDHGMDERVRVQLRREKGLS